MKTRDIQQIINNEIKWCKENREKTEKSTDFQKGFIEGLKQAKDIIVRLNRDFL